MTTACSENREAVSAFLAAARRVPAAQWEAPRAPGRWSPREITEHLARTYEISRDALHGAYPGPAAPRFLRPVIRAVFLKPILRNGRFGKGGKTPPPFRPGPEPAAIETLAARLEAASERLATDLDQAVRAGNAEVDHPFFGRIRGADYLRLQAIHANHHRLQLPGGMAR